MRRAKGLALLVSFAVVALALAGCGQGGEHKAGVDKAVAVVYPTAGSKVKGFVSLTKAKDGVRVVADLEGLSPGKHGFHIHEYGDCSSPDAASAGGHFDPAGNPHGAPNVDKHHEGDMGNIEADQAGNARIDVVFKGMAFDGPASVLGRGVIVHAQADDFTTQPTGGSGARVACGVIGVAK